MFFWFSTCQVLRKDPCYKTGSMGQADIPPWGDGGMRSDKPKDLHTLMHSPGAWQQVVKAWGWMGRGWEEGSKWGDGG